MSNDSLIASIRPAQDQNEELLESAAEYSARVAKLLPNFPNEVISQWLYEHISVIDDWKWIDFRSLRFDQIEIGAQTLRMRCLAENQIVAQYRDYFLQGKVIDRMRRISGYFKVHGTWPVAPILFHTRGGYQSVIAQPGGYRFPRPLHLVEGHHRLAIWYALSGSKPMKDTHRAWLMRKVNIM